MRSARSLILRTWGAIPVVLVVALLGLRACVHVDPLDRLAPVAARPDDPAGTVPLGGTIYVARGGPLIIGFQSAAPARLTFASHDIQGAGVIKERIIVEAGPLPLRFAAPPGSRLVWSPVGRRGDPEYVSASSLSPDPPETATFSHPGTALGDGVFALGLLLVLVGSLLMLARRRLAKVSRATWIALGVTFGLALLVRCIGLGDEGQTWDEDVNWAAARNYITNVLALDARDTSWVWNLEHPPVMKLLDGIGAQFADGFGPARVLSAIWISLGCALLVPIGARLASLRTGVLAAVIAALLPPLVAHGQIVGHESPSVLWWSLGILLSLGVHDDLPEDRRAAMRSIVLRLCAVGACVGIACASRFVNGLLGPLCVVIIVVRAPGGWIRQTTLALWVTVVAAILVFIAVWPRMWHHPLAHLDEALKRLRNLHTAEPFLGAMTNKPGAGYFLVYLYATAPLGMLIALAAGFARISAQRTRSHVLVLAWFVVPLFVVASPVRQDGVRYVMPCLTAMAMIAALGIDWLAIRLERRTKRAFAGLSVVFALYLGITLARAHPYYLDYFGEQVGGAGGVEAQRLGETAWWGEGVDRAVDYVNAHAPFGAAIHRDCIQPGHLAWFREDLWTAMTSNMAVADFIVWYSPTSQVCTIPGMFREVFSVTAGGATFAKVYARR